MLSEPSPNVPAKQMLWSGNYEHGPVEVVQAAHDIGHGVPKHGGLARRWEGHGHDSRRDIPSPWKMQ